MNIKGSVGVSMRIVVPSRKSNMNKFLSLALISLLFASFFSFSLPSTGAAADLAPLIPNRIKVLVVSPADIYYSGANYLTSDLARYGFNVTLQASNNALTTNYLNDSKTANLNQYDVVIVHGILGFPSAKVSAEEVAHFTSYRGILILIGNALMQNETADTWWDLSSTPFQEIDQRVGVNFTGFLGEGGAWHNPGNFNLSSSLIPGLPQSLSYKTEQYGSIDYQINLTTNGATSIYDFTIVSSPSQPLDGKTTRGVTFYKANDGAVGIYIQGAYIYGSGSGTQINYFGLTDGQSRSALLASLIAFSVNKDVSTIVKPQPLANIRLDGVGQYLLPGYLNASLANFNSFLAAHNITPTIGLIDYLPFTPPLDYWKTVAPEILAQLKTKYRDWEYSTNLRYYPLPDTRTMTETQIQGLIDNIKSNYTRLGMDLFSTVIAPQGRWNQSTLDAMAIRNLYLLELRDTDYSDWWNIRVNSSVLVHGGAPILPETAENFTQPNMDPNSINYQYFSRRDEWSLALANGYPSFVYFVPNFRQNQVGTYSLMTVYNNLTSEAPDVRFVPSIEAGLFFGNKWLDIANASRSGSTIEFDIDASKIPSAVNIGKGMVWLRIDANESIQDVSINNSQWSYFDEHSIRIPTPDTIVHVRVTLGASLSPRVADSRYKVTEANYDGFKLQVALVSARALNVTVDVFLPQVGPFAQDNWNMFTLEVRWGNHFNARTRLLRFWTISDGQVNFKVGLFWVIKRTPPLYNSSVTVTANFSALGVATSDALLSYNVSAAWTNLTMTLQSGAYVAEIPAMRYGTIVSYKVFVLIDNSRWLGTEVFTYKVGDTIPPDIGEATWDPSSPLSGQSVKVSIPTSEPANASGVAEVDLKYYSGNQIAQTKIIVMTDDNGTWTGEIPGQGGGSTITFFVSAQDKAGNLAQTETFTYAVQLTPIPLPILALIIVVAAAVGIGAFLYFWRFRRKVKVEGEQDGATTAESKPTKTEKLP